MGRRWSLAMLCERRGIDYRQLAELSGVDEVHVLAMVRDRWTPSPEQRDAVAAVFGLTRDEIAWGHAATVFGH
jgi:transcriptional regulator with XRE-family HTH domain